MTYDREMLTFFRDYRSEHLGCHDASCPFVFVRGMHTNGGCKCVKDIVAREVSRDLNLLLTKTNQFIRKTFDDYLEQAAKNVPEKIVSIEYPERYWLLKAGFFTPGEPLKSAEERLERIAELGFFADRKFSKKALFSKLEKLFIENEKEGADSVLRNAAMGLNKLSVKLTDVSMGKKEPVTFLDGNVEALGGSKSGSEA